MANIATLTFTVDRTSGDLSDIFVSSNPNLALSNMQNYLSGIAGGSQSASINVKINTGNAGFATADVTVDAPVAGDELEINGVSFIAGTTFVIGASDAATATNLAAAINASASALISGLLTASATDDTVTITAATSGVSGNAITLEGKGTGGIDVDGSGAHASATLTCASVAAADTAVINGVTLTAVDKKEKTQVTTVADTGALEVTVVTVPATAGATQGDYFVLSNTAAATVAFWIDIDDAGTEPTGAAYVASNSKIRIDVATGGTAIANATILAAAAASILGFNAVDNGNATVTYTQTIMGNCTNAAKHNADDSGDGSFTFSGEVNGAASNLNSSYFTYVTRATGGASTNSRYLWLNINGEGVNPAPGGTGISVALAKGATNTTVATAVRAALAADTNVVITGATTHVIITNAFMGTATDTADGVAATGFTFTKVTDGVASNLLNSFLTFFSAADATKYGLWFNINGEGVAPTITGVSAGNRIAVAAAAGASANVVATAGRAVFLSTPLSTDFVESGATDKITFRNNSVGATTNAADGSAATGFTFTVQIAGGAVAATEFQITASNTNDATALKALINAQAATLALIVVATSLLGVVTVTALEEGIEGNNITLSATGGITASLSRLAGGTASAIMRLSGGANDSGSTTYNMGR